jgi:hypothetical protein
MCSVLEPGRTEWNVSIPRAWNGSDPVFGSEKFEERNGSIPVFSLEWDENGMEWNENEIILNSIIYFLNWINYY